MKRNKQDEKKELFALAKLAEQALKEAVHETIQDHERTGDPIVIWRNGKVVHIHPSKLKLAERPAFYKTRKIKPQKKD
ncbi:MAG TPA: hypothetical protein VD913_05125 [bacterium]|nr:hypothetical protein [bacterium]